MFHRSDVALLTTVFFLSIAAVAKATPTASPAAADAAAVSAASAKAVVEHQRLGYDLAYIVRTTIARDLPAWRAAAGNGDRAGNWLLGLCNYYGIGGPRNAARGRDLIRAAAEAGDAEAMGVLSLILRAGDLDTPPDADHANEWLGRALKAHGRIAADVLPIAAADELLAKGDIVAAMDAYARESKAGNANASVALAGVLRRGWLTPLDVDGSIRLLTAAANAGHVGAMVELAHTYSDGRVVTPSQPAVGRKWFDAAAATGDAMALYEAEVAYASGRIGGHGPNPRDADPVRAEALRGQLRANGDPFSSFAKFLVEDALSKGPRGKKINERLMHDELLDAATRGVPATLFYLSISMREGSYGFEKDVVRSNAVLEHGVASGDARALYLAGLARRFGWYERADEAAAVPLIFAAARRGVPQAMTSVALRLHTGRGGVTMDLPKAHFAYFAAAMAGDPDAMAAVADDYAKGTGIDRAPDRAEVWAWIAIAQGSPEGYTTLYELNGGRVWGAPLGDKARDAIIAGTDAGSLHCAGQLGLRLIRGDGLPADPKRGLAILEAAAPRDNYGKTHMLLGDAYRDGLGGVPREPWRAMGYYRVAADRGEGSAWAAIADLYRLGQGVAADPAEAVRCLERGMALGSDIAFERMGTYYAYGWCVKEDVPRGMDFWRKAADRGSGEAARLLGDHLLHPQWVGPNAVADVDEALKWLDRAVVLGEPTAARTAGTHFRDVKDYANEKVWLERGDRLGDAGCASELGVMYQYGNGVPQDWVQAAACYRRGAERGAAISMVNYANCCEDGSGVAKDPAEAFRLYVRAAAIAGAAESDDVAMHQLYLKTLMTLGRMHIDGVGTPRDVQAGLASIKRAADAGSDQAQAMIKAARAKGLMP